MDDGWKFLGGDEEEDQELILDKPPISQRRVTILGKSLPLLLVIGIGLLVLSGATTAVLLTKFSNPVKVELSVNQPLSPTCIYTGLKTDSSGTCNTQISPNVYGGESFEYTTMTKNDAKVDIKGLVESKLTGEASLSGAEANEILLRRYDNNTGSWVWTPSYTSETDCSSNGKVWYTSVGCFENLTKSVSGGVISWSNNNTWHKSTAIYSQYIIRFSPLAGNGSYSLYSDITPLQ
jgi:hypothetical protein